MGDRPLIFRVHAVGIEQLMDTAARQIGVDPLDLRRRNVIQAEDLPYTLPSTLSIDAITPAETLEQAASMVGYKDFRAEQAIARNEGRYSASGSACACSRRRSPSGHWAPRGR